MNWPLAQFRHKDVVFVGVGQRRSIDGFKDFITQYGQVRSFKGVDKDNQAENPLKFLEAFDQDQTIFVKNEGIPSKEMPVPYVTPINVFFECAEMLKAKTVGITGTKGKSTTSSLTAAMLKAGGMDARLVGNIGHSVFKELDDATASTVFVIELSSYQLSDIKHSPQVSACINLYTDHMDWHGSKEIYWKAKRNIIAKSHADDLFIYNPEFPELVHWAKEAKCKTEAIDKNEDIDMSQTRLFGEHNRVNAILARQIARSLGVTDENCQKALNNFTPLPHRMEYVAEKGGKVYIDDAIGMTPESTTASMKAVAEKYGNIGCLLLGGQDRGYDFRNLFAFIQECKIPSLALFPNTVEKMEQAFPEGYSPEIFKAEDMESAVKWASEHAPDKSVVLLSTAAPSYSLWPKGFEEKGDLFKKAVSTLN